MEKTTGEILTELRQKQGLTQEQLAERLMISRQAVSRWETGESVPNTETLKLISREFGVSINALLGISLPLYCQCCGMPLEEEIISRETDGTPNREYCQWCYAGGRFQYDDMESLLDYLVPVMSSRDPSQPPEKLRKLLESHLIQLKHWKQTK
ncbi:MAG: helix-turn-helix domain-containing protein [Clostridiales bacterium]|nr:helix-turn-helix domain-containing protein [Clostridiales bacterium]